MSSAPRGPFKRLIVLSDGTWQTLENDEPTNILKLALAIDKEDKHGVQQLVFYDQGVGSNGGLDNILGGIGGLGIDENIQQLYTFLALNYDDGDEIYMFGFSRGAFTVRSLAGMINDSGLVRRREVQWVKEAYDLYHSDTDAEEPKAISFRRDHGERVPIKLLACFDTVGALGLPGPLKYLNGNKYKFHDITLGEAIENAIHMLSIDEVRDSFTPTLMKPNKKVGDDQLTQKYFWGVHSGVGGGDGRELEASKCTLNFLVGEMQRRSLALQFDMKMIPEEFDLSADVGQPVRSFQRVLMEVVGGRGSREIKSINDIHDSAIKRYQVNKNWRPGSLSSFTDRLLKFVLQ